MPNTSPPRAHLLSRPIWFVIGVCALLLGLIGVVLPVLPSTPFVILAAFAFGKSSLRMRAFLLNHRLFGPMILDWETHGAIAPRYKRIAFTLMGAAFLFSVLTGVKPIVLIVQALCMGGAAGYIATRPNSP